MNSASCARPGCASTPAAWLAYDYGARCAWIDDQPDGGAGKVGKWPLCERHADNLRVPRGWFCVDRRGGNFVPDAVDLDSSGGQVGQHGAGPEGTPEGSGAEGSGPTGANGEAGGPDQPGRRRRTSAGRLTAIL